MTKDDLVVGTVGTIIAAIVSLTGISSGVAEGKVEENIVQVVEKSTPEKIKKKYSNATSLSDRELKELLRAVGFEGNNLKMAWAVAKKESNGRPLAFNNNTKTGDHSFGIFQINMIGELKNARIEKFELNSLSDLFNPVINAEVAYYMTDGGKNWSSWTNLEGERIKEFLAKYPKV